MDRGAHLLVDVGTVLVPEAVRLEAGTVPDGAMVVSPTAEGVVRALSLQLGLGAPCKSTLQRRSTPSVGGTAVCDIPKGGHAIGEKGATSEVAPR